MMAPRQPAFAAAEGLAPPSVVRHQDPDGSLRIELRGRWILRSTRERITELIGLLTQARLNRAHWDLSHLDDLDLAAASLLWRTWEYRRPADLDKSNPGRAPYSGRELERRSESREQTERFAPTQPRISSMRHLTVSMLACALLAGTAMAADPPSAPTTAEQPSATIDLTGGTVAAGIGYVWGRGHLIYKGATHAFELHGVSIVDVGASHISASGVVYNLRNVRDFNGSYTTVSAGLTVAGGGSVVVLRNQNGVVIKLLSTAEGLRFNLSADGVSIKLRT